MTQRNRAKLEVEGLEDRITPASISCLQSQLQSLKATLHANIHNFPKPPCPQLQALKTSLSAKIHTWQNWSTDSSHVHDAICAALQHAYDKLVAKGAPQAALNIVIGLQAHFGCELPIG